MTNDHDRYAGWAGAYTLGALDAEDRRAFETHVATCQICGAELAALAPLPALIAKVDPSEVEHDPDPVRAAAVAAAASRQVRALHRRGRAWQIATGVLAAVALLLAVALVVTSGEDHDDTPPTVVASVVESAAATTDVAVVPRGWGTEIVLHITGLPARDGYELWTIAADGTWSSAATWLPTSSGNLRLTGASRTPADRLVRILVTSANREDVLVDAAL